MVSESVYPLDSVAHAMVSVVRGRVSLQSRDFVAGSLLRSLSIVAPLIYDAKPYERAEPPSFILELETLTDSAPRLLGASHDGVLTIRVGPGERYGGPVLRCAEGLVERGVHGVECGDGAGIDMGQIPHDTLVTLRFVGHPPAHAQILLRTVYTTLAIGTSESPAPRTSARASRRRS